MAAARLRSGHPPPATGALDPPLPDDFGDPLAVIAIAHARQRALGGRLKQAAGAGEIARAVSDPLIACLGYELPQHHDDLDRDLFPMLRRRILPEDALVPVLARLSEDHRRAESQAQAIVDLLVADPVADPIRLTAPARDLFLAQAALTQRLVSLENGIVLAIARVRLTRADLKALGRAFRARRGMEAP